MTDNDILDYEQYQKIKALKKSMPEFINDLATEGVDVGYCDDCNVQLTIWNNQGGLACSRCGRLYSPEFERIKHGSKAGPIDFVDDSELENDTTTIIEEYSFDRRKQKPDPFIDSLKARGYVITDSKSE